MQKTSKHFSRLMGAALSLTLAAGVMVTAPSLGVSGVAGDSASASTPPSPTDTSNSTPAEPSREPSTPYIPPITVKGDFGVELILKESQLPEGVKAADLRLPVTMPAPDAIAATLASHPELPAAKDINLFDIALTDANGDAVKFTGKATVRVPLDEMGGFLRAFFHDGSGTLSELNASINGNYVEFQVEHFSEYAVVDFASSVGKLPATMTALKDDAASATSATTVTTADAGDNAASNPTTGAFIPFLAIFGCAGACAVVMKVAKKR